MRGQNPLSVLALSLETFDKRLQTILCVHIIFPHTYVETLQRNLIKVCLWLV